MRQYLIPAMYLLYLFITVSCNTNSSGENDAETEEWIVRTPAPDSIFTPTDLEQSIEAVIGELNHLSEEETTGQKIHIIPKHSDDFFEPILAGTQLALEELQLEPNIDDPGILVNTNAPPMERQQEFLTGYLDEIPSGVAIAPIDAILEDEINSVVEAGATVVTFDSDLPNSLRQFYVGTINENAGMVGGQTMVRLLQADSGTIIVQGFLDDGWEAGKERTEGALNMLEGTGYEITVVQVNWDNPFGTSDLEAALLASDPPAVGMLGLFGNSYTCADAAVAQNMASDLVIVAFDFEPETISYMETGIIQATHVQRQHYMGYLLPYVIVATNLLGEERTRAIFSNVIMRGDLINTGLDVVMNDQLDEYEQYVQALRRPN